MPHFENRRAGTRLRVNPAGLEIGEVDFVPVGDDIFLGLLQGDGSGADLFLQQVFHFVLLMGAHGFLADLGVVRLGPKIFGVFGIATDFERNEMILFVVLQLRIAVAVLGDAFFFQVVGVIGGWADGGGPVGDADGLVNVGLGHVWIGRAGSELGIGVEIFGAGFGGSDGGFQVHGARGSDVGGASGEERSGGGEEETRVFLWMRGAARTERDCAAVRRSCGDTSTGVEAVQGEGRRRGGGGVAATRIYQRFDNLVTNGRGEEEFDGLPRTAGRTERRGAARCVLRRSATGGGQCPSSGSH